MSTRMCRWFAAWAVLSACLLSGSAIGAEWRPEGNIEIVVPSGAGSGLDRTGRALQKALHDLKLLPTPSIVMNKPGAGGTVAYRYLNQHSGNGHYVSITSPGIVTNKIIGLGDVDYRDVTPIAQLFDENIVFMVLPNSKIKDGRMLIEILRKDPGAVSLGIATALGGANHIAAASALKAAGVDVKNLHTIVYKSGGDVTVALLGGHVDVVPIAAPVARGQKTAGKVRVIAISSAKRMGGPFADVPTWRELGIDSTYATWRGLVGPRGMKPEQVAFWEGVITTAVASEDWRNVLDRNGWVSNPLTGAQARAFLERERKLHQEMLAELGLAK